MQPYGGDGETAELPPVKQLLLYAAGSASRGVFSILAPYEGTGTMLLIRPRGSALSSEARGAVAAHPVAEAEGMHISLDAVDSWEVPRAAMRTWAWAWARACVCGRPCMCVCVHRCACASGGPR